MKLSKQQKDELKKELVSCLIPDRKIEKIVVFGSFVESENPNDMDVAVFQNSSEGYIPIAMKYRKRIRSVSKKIPVDIIPLKSHVTSDPFLSEIGRGEVVYER